MLLGRLQRTSLAKVECSLSVTQKINQVMFPSNLSRLLPGAQPLPGHSGHGQRQGMPDAQLARALAKAAHPIVIIDRSGAVLWCNGAYTLLVAKPLDQVLRKKPNCLEPTKDNARFLKDVWEIVMSRQIWKGELIERKPNGSTVHLDAVMTPLDDPHGNAAVFMLFLNDITERKVEYDKVWRQANHDQLTGLANRGFFLSMLEHMTSTSQRNHSSFALLYIDLDGFKTANDTFGHAVGDDVLIETGEILKNNVRRSDFVARLGGDEFACLLGEIKSAQDAGDVATKIIESLYLMKDIGPHKVTIGASIGIAFYPENGISQEDLVRKADAAMYAAKKAGKNCFRMAKD